MAIEFLALVLLTFALLSLIRFLCRRSRRQGERASREAFAGLRAEEPRRAAIEIAEAAERGFALGVSEAANLCGEALFPDFGSHKVCLMAKGHNREYAVLAVAGGSGRTRTCGPLLRRQMLCPPELRSPLLQRAKQPDHSSTAGGTE